MEYSIQAFVDQLLVEKGINVPADVLEQIRTDLLERAENLVNASILSNMPESALEEFEALLDQGSDTDIQLFCTKNIVNLDEVVARSLMKLREMYLFNTAQ